MALETILVSKIHLLHRVQQSQWHTALDLLLLLLLLHQRPRPRPHRRCCQLINSSKM